jgi:hypothetical protein
MDKHEILSTVTFGHRVAEEETDVLEAYFVETDDWNRLFRGEIDVVYGPKGAGKSALYSLLLAKSGDLFDKGILLISGENPRGATAFRDLATNPPASEREFVGLWKLSIYSFPSPCLSGRLRDREFQGRAASNTDPELQSVDRLIELASGSLSEAGARSWVILDRLDVAFAENAELEANALRALFRVYLDLAAFPAVTLKIFLRSDIWSRITAEGFREASSPGSKLEDSFHGESLNVESAYGDGHTARAPGRVLDSQLHPGTPCQPSFL